MWWSISLPLSCSASAQHIKTYLWGCFYPTQDGTKQAETDDGAQMLHWELFERFPGKTAVSVYLPQHGCLFTLSLCFKSVNSLWDTCSHVFMSASQCLGCWLCGRTYSHERNLHSHYSSCSAAALTHPHILGSNWWIYSHPWHGHGSQKVSLASMPRQSATILFIWAGSPGWRKC